MNDDWYRNTRWNEQIEIEFEQRFEKTRSDYNKAEYLRIQANYLLNSSSDKEQKIGLVLIDRLFDSFPEQIQSIMLANEILGNYFFKHQSYIKAEEYLRKVVSYYHEVSREGTSGIADLKLCELILQTEQKMKYQEAKEIATNKFGKSGGELILAEDKFYHAYICANLFYELGEFSEASLYATNAINIIDNLRSDQSKNIIVGQLKVSNAQIEVLRTIKMQSDL